MFLIADIVTCYCCSKKSIEENDDIVTNYESYAEENIYAEVIYDETTFQYDHLRFDHQENYRNSQNNPLNNYDRVFMQNKSESVRERNLDNESDIVIIY